MKIIRVLIVGVLAFAVAAPLLGCKKKEAPTAAKTATAATVAAAVTCPKPGEDLICQECKTLFTTPDEYAAHMEKVHPEKWAAMSEEFHKNFPAPGTAKK